MKKRVISMAVCLGVCGALVGFSKPQVSANAQTQQVKQINQPINMKNQKLKTFLEDLQKRGFKIANIRQLDSKATMATIEDSLKKGIKLESLKMGVHEHHSIWQLGDDGYVVQINGEEFELYDCSNCSNVENKEQIKQNKDGVLGVLDHPGQKETRWVTVMYKNHIKLMADNNKPYKELRKAFDESTMK